jgi:hypothetical protein
VHVHHFATRMPMYCYSAYNDGTYVAMNVAMNLTGWQTASNDFCDDLNYVLQPGNAVGFYKGYMSPPDGVTVVAAISWTRDQTGCLGEAAFALGQGRGGFENCFRFCKFFEFDNLCDGWLGV